MKNNFKKAVTDELQIELSAEETTRIVCDLLKVMEKICRKEGLEYFAYARLLVYAVHYHQLAPYNWHQSFDVGMLRKDYDRFCKVAAKYEEMLNFKVRLHPVFDVKRQYRAHFLYITREVEITSGDITVTDEFRLRIAPFDKVPEEEDTRSGFYRAMKHANNVHRRTIDQRFYLEKSKGAFAKFCKQHLLYGNLDSKDTYRHMNEVAQKYNKTNSKIYQRVVGKRSEPILKDQLFPIQRVTLGDMTIPVPKDVTPWTEPDLHAFDERNEKIRKVDLEILQEFDRICRKIGVGYFLCGGTMLGYVRNNGFIPWDDDIDCGMLRKDYQKFLAEANQYLDHEKFFLQTRESDPSIPFLFSKLRRNNTLYVTEYNERRPYHKGICLDIFPFDYIPNDPVERELHRVKAKKCARKHHFVVNRAKGNPPADEKLKTKEDYWYRLLGTAHRHLFRSIPLSVTQKNYDKFVQQYNSRAKELDLHTVASFVPTYTWADISTLLPYKTVDFEGVQAMVANKPEVFLEMQYGDYMTPPKPHKQVGHDLIDWSVEEEQSEKDCARTEHQEDETSPQKDGDQ